MIDLEPFVSKDNGTTYDMTRSWVFAGWRYATNGRIAIRVPDAGPDVLANAGDPPFPPTADLFKAVEGTRQPWPERRYCPQCLDTGTIGCGVCGRRRCRLCNGREPSGQLTDGGNKLCLDVGNHWIDAKYDDLIRDLPNVSFVQIVDPTRPLPFYFEGGEGRVMGVRREVLK